MAVERCPRRDVLSAVVYPAFPRPPPRLPMTLPPRSGCGPCGVPGLPERRSRGRGRAQAERRHGTGAESGADPSCRLSTVERLSRSDPFLERTPSLGSEPRWRGYPPASGEPPPPPPRTPAPTKRHSGPEGFCEGSFHVTLRYSRALTHPFAESRRRDVLTYSKTLPRSASESPQDLAAPGVVLSYAPWIATKAVSILRRKERLKCLPRQAFQSALIPP